MKKTVLILLPLIILFSCQKDPVISPSSSCDITMKNVAGPYKVTKASYKNKANSSEIDFYDALFPEICDQDDIVNLKEDGTYDMEDAGTRCSPANDFSGTWSISQNKIITDGESADIVQFDCNKTLVVSLSGIYASGDKLTITYTHQ
jgi:hypothetical protein